MAKTAAVWLPRIIFGLALVGVFLVTHMYLQESLGRGCFGSAADHSVACGEVSASSAGKLFGVSNTLLGLLFYVGIAVLRFFYVALKNDQFRKLAFVGTAIGFAYSAYLTIYQYVSPELISVDTCRLCLTSAAIATTIFILHVMENNKLKKSPANRAVFAMKPIAIMALVGLLAIAGGVANAMGMFGGEPETAAVDAAENANDLTLNGEQTDPAAQIEITDPITQCTYDPEYETLEGIEPFLDGPYLGAADASVQVVKVFDPNCPHCKTLHETLEEVAENNGDKARFYLVAYPIWEHSFGQVQALRMAAAQGKFHPMLGLMFDRQDPNGLTLDQVIEIASEVGMDGPTFRTQIEDRGASQPILADIMADRLALAEIISDAEGRVSVPKLIIDNRMIQATYQSYTQTCLEYFIDQAYAVRTGETG